VKIYCPQGYRTVNVGGRVLQVPTAADRASQREIYEQVKAVRPVSFQPEAIQESIRAAFQSNPGLKALRTDVKDCFGTIPQPIVEQEILKLPIAHELQQGLINVFRPLSRGLPTGSPLSPWLAELVLRLVDQEMHQFDYYRYADDLCVLGNAETCQAALGRLKATLVPWGMELGANKTRILSQSSLVFLGRSYEELQDRRVLEADLGGESLGLPNNKHLFFRVNLAGQPYTEKEGNPTYSLPCLFNRMLTQPTPYILEMLMLRPQCSDHELARIIANPDSIVDQKLPGALHGKTYRHYVNRVKPRVLKKSALPIGEAGEVYRWLYLANEIMKTGKLPSSYSAIEDEWSELLASLEAGDFNPYHKRIKQLFKEEHALRELPKPTLPATKSAIELSIT
jgi:hypothetical protein